jgi:predicted RND superfamily exporter protein
MKVTTLQGLEPLITKLAAIIAIVILVLRYDGSATNDVILALITLLAGQTVTTAVATYVGAKYAVTTPQAPVASLGVPGGVSGA